MSNPGQREKMSPLCGSLMSRKSVKSHQHSAFGRLVGLLRCTKKGGRARLTISSQNSSRINALLFSFFFSTLLLPRRRVHVWRRHRTSCLRECGFGFRVQIPSPLFLFSRCCMTKWKEREIDQTCARGEREAMHALDGTLFCQEKRCNGTSNVRARAYI